MQLPIKPLNEQGIYGQLFVNGCNNVLLSGQGREPKQILTDFKDTFRWSGVCVSCFQPSVFCQDFAAAKLNPHDF